MREFSKPCPCGSGQLSRWQYDARGIELCRTCPKCHEKKMSGYRPEVLNDSNYEAEEQIEPDCFYGQVYDSEEEDT